MSFTVFHVVLFFLYSLHVRLLLEHGYLVLVLVLLPGTVLLRVLPHQAFLIAGRLLEVLLVEDSLQQVLVHLRELLLVEDLVNHGRGDFVGTDLLVRVRKT